jgi:hypothetical protein
MITTRTKDNNAAHRLNDLLNYSKSNKSAFAKSIGLASAQNLQSISSGQCGISARLAGIICRRYPEVSYTWLVSGNGAMLNPQPDFDQKIAEVWTKIDEISAKIDKLLTDKPQ